MRKKLTVQVQATQSQCVLCFCCQLVSSVRAPRDLERPFYAIVNTHSLEA